MSRGSERLMRSSVNEIFERMSSGLAPLPWSCPEVHWVDELASDGYAKPGHVFVRRSILRGDPVFCHLTVAHEVAHQWWGLRVTGSRFWTETMAELHALDSVESHLGSEAARIVLRCARGRLLHLLLGVADSHYLQECEELGRGLLAAYAWRRRFGIEATGILAEISSGLDASDRDALLLASRNHEAAASLVAWSSSARTLPTPRCADGQLQDVDNTGLATFVTVARTDDALATRDVWLDGRVPLDPDWGIATEQYGPVLAGDLIADHNFLAARQP